MEEKEDNESLERDKSMAESSQEILDRNACLILALNELQRSRQDAEPGEAEKELWLEASRNLANVVSAIPPKELLGSDGIQPYVDWAWSSGMMPTPRFGSQIPVGTSPYNAFLNSVCNNFNKPDAYLEMGQGGGHVNHSRGVPFGGLPAQTQPAFSIPNTDGLRLQRNIMGGSSGLDNSQGEALFHSTGFVNIVSPLARGPGTAPVIIGTPQGDPEGKNETGL